MATTTTSIDQMNFDDINLVPPPPPPPQQPGKFLAVLGKVATVAGNALVPGMGGLIGNMLGGAGGLGTDPTQYLLLQQRIQAEARQYETVSAVLKAKHDAAMDCLRNVSH